MLRRLAFQLPDMSRERYVNLTAYMFSPGWEAIVHRKSSGYERISRWRQGSDKWEDCMLGVEFKEYLDPDLIRRIQRNGEEHPAWFLTQMERKRDNRSKLLQRHRSPQQLNCAVLPPSIASTLLAHKIEVGAITMDLNAVFWIEQLEKNANPRLLFITEKSEQFRG
jgi:hypothetical protein